MSDDFVGRLIGGRFRLVRRLGAGGMGAVYVADDTRDGDRRVAVKLIRDTLADQADVAARFDREVSALRQVPHDNIVAYIDAGIDGTTRWLAMELLEGRTLKERIHSRGSIPWAETLPIVRGIVRALEAAHAKGLIHRDLKPENVFLVDGAKPGDLPSVKLLDFGVAKHTTLPEGMTMTGTGILVGTPGFVAPEVVLKGSSDDPRSDFYGLGATWFEMLAGSKPFDAATPFALAMLHVNERPPRVSDLRPFAPVPDVVEALLAALLAKTPEARPPTATALLAELDRLIQATQSGEVLPSALATLTDLKTPQPTTLVASLTPETSATSASPLHPVVGAIASAGLATTEPAPATVRGPRRRNVAAVSAMVAIGCVLSALVLVVPVRKETPAVIPVNGRIDPREVVGSEPGADAGQEMGPDAGPDAGLEDEEDAGPTAAVTAAGAGPSPPVDAGVPVRKSAKPTGKPRSTPQLMEY